MNIMKNASILELMEWLANAGTYNTYPERYGNVFAVPDFYFFLLNKAYHCINMTMKRWKLLSKKKKKIFGIYNMIS
jgi:hypothetical protein